MELVRLVATEVPVLVGSHLLRSQRQVVPALQVDSPLSSSHMEDASPLRTGSRLLAVRRFGAN